MPDTLFENQFFAHDTPYENSTVVHLYFHSYIN